MAASDDARALQELNRTLGTLIGKVDGLAQDVAESRQESKEHRKRVYDRLEENEAAAEKSVAAVLARLDALEATTAGTIKTVAEIKPVFDAMQVWKHRGVGFTAAVALAFALIGGGVVLKWEAIVAFFGRMFGNS